ncbi:hypothetical protein [Sulfurimonas sp.]
MKKTSIIVVLFILFAIAMLPIVGNEFMQNKVQDATTLLSAQGLKVKKIETNSGYLSTQKHFEFIVEDSSAFIRYINTHSYNQLPLYSRKTLDGSVIGCDIKYSNIPFAKTIDVDLYPLKLSQLLSNDLKTEDINFYNKFSDFLQNKGVLYHVEYNLINSKFKGYIKDINQKYHLQNKSDVNIELKGAKFSGKGNILNPKVFSSKVKRIYFNASQNKVKSLFAVNNFSASNDFTSFSKYDSAAKIGDLKFIISGVADDVNISLAAFKTKSNAKIKNKKVKLESQTTLKELTLNSQNLSLRLENLHGNIQVSGIEKSSFELLSKMVQKSQNINNLTKQKKVQELTTKLLEKGFKIDIKDISLKHLTLNQKEDLGGFKMSSDLEVKEDENLSQKLQISPLLLLSNITMKSDIELSKALYTKILNTTPMSSMISGYAKEKKDDVIFKINFLDSKLTVNGKAIQ